MTSYSTCNTCLDSRLNPLGTTGLLTPFLIGSYHEMFTCSANYDKSLKMLHHKLSHETIFLTPSLIGSINARIFILTNRQVVLIDHGSTHSYTHNCILCMPMTTQTETGNMLE